MTLFHRNNDLSCAFRVEQQIKQWNVDSGKRITTAKKSFESGDIESIGSEKIEPATKTN
jgi:hypothetical protein